MMQSATIGKDAALRGSTPGVQNAPRLHAAGTMRSRPSRFFPGGSSQEPVGGSRLFDVHRAIRDARFFREPRSPGSEKSSQFVEEEGITDDAPPTREPPDLECSLPLSIFPVEFAAEQGSRIFVFSEIDQASDVIEADFNIRIEKQDPGTARPADSDVGSCGKTDIRPELQPERMARIEIPRPVLRGVVDDKDFPDIFAFSGCP